MLMTLINAAVPINISDLHITLHLLTPWYYLEGDSSSTKDFYCCNISEVTSQFLPLSSYSQLKSRTNISPDDCLCHPQRQGGDKTQLHKDNSCPLVTVPYFCFKYHTETGSEIFFFSSDLIFWFSYQSFFGFRRQKL